MTEKKVDEKWKNQVDKDRDTTPPPAKGERVPEPAASEHPKAESAEREAGPGQMPPAEFGMFISSLGLQALMALGEIENPITNKKDPDQTQAKYLIDTIGMLQEKTKGNLTREEDSMIEQILYELRMKYVDLNK